MIILCVMVSNSLSLFYTRFPFIFNFKCYLVLTLLLTFANNDKSIHVAIVILKIQNFIIVQVHLI